MRKVRTISFSLKSGNDALLLKRDIDNCQFKSGFQIPKKYLDFGNVITTADIKALYADLQKNISREIINFTISDEVWERKTCGYGHDQGEEIEDTITIKTFKYTVKSNQYLVEKDGRHLYSNEDGVVYKDNNLFTSVN
jgi:hypothetical protein